jgi:hypothetical protein
MFQLTKTDFIKFQNCAKSFWLERNKPEVYPHGKFSGYMKKLAQEGYEVEAHFKALILSRSDHRRFQFQFEFTTADRFLAKADAVRHNDDGTIDIFEVKSSTSVKKDAKHDQVKDAAFQMIVAKAAGYAVRTVTLVHLNGSYVRQGDIEPDNLLEFVDITEQVAEVEPDTKVEAVQALELLKLSAIDETSCPCLYKGKRNHCDAFDYFNRDLPTPSVYSLPRMYGTKLAGFVSGGRFDLNEIAGDEVSKGQLPVLKAAHGGEVLVDRVALAEYIDQLQYPLYFYDYETYSSAVPIMDGASPQKPIPFQYSLHIMAAPDDDKLTHVEYLADEAVPPFSLIEHMQEHIGSDGSVISWHASFENTQNKNMAVAYPEKAAFLESLIERTVDLEDPFKQDYVDIAFDGSTSIKKVLPVLVPELSYGHMEVANGTEAMDGWKKLISLPNSPEKQSLRKAMLDYCELDTLAMVKIFNFLRAKLIQ